MLPDAREKDTFGSREIPTASALSNVRQSFSFQLRDCPGECWRPGDTSIVQYASRQQPVIRSGESPERVSSDAARPGQKNRAGPGCVAGKQIPRPNRFLSRDSETSWSTGTQRLAESGWYHRRQLFESKICLLYTSPEPTRRTPISYAVFCLKKK